MTNQVIAAFSSNAGRIQRALLQAGLDAIARHSLPIALSIQRISISFFPHLKKLLRVVTRSAARRGIRTLA
ncbi:hypothetical protein [Paraburkholderia ribeironis]|nr:hypothetical protein [Paraburkholderia ribeironis]